MNAARTDGSSGEASSPGSRSLESGRRREPARLAVMISGGGRSLLNLLDAIEAGSLNATIALVIASRPCAGVERAAERGLDVRVMRGRIGRATLEQVLVERRIDWVVLAGYLSYLEIPERYRGRVVNIHPSLLPGFGGAGMYGHHVHEAVIRSGVRESGCTVHLVDEKYDEGPIVLQLRCPVLPTDTPETLAARVFELECRAYPEALRTLIGNA